MSLRCQLVIVRMNPQARGSIAAGCAPEALANTVWLSPQDLATLNVTAGECLNLRAQGAADSSGNGSTVAIPEELCLVAASAGTELMPGTALMASSAISARLAAAETAGSGTPTFKGIEIELSRARNRQPILTSAAALAAMAHETQVLDHSSPRVTIDDAVCTACGCICDDIRLTAIDTQIEDAEHACEIGREWFIGESQRQTSLARDATTCWIDGTPAPLSEGLRRAAEILQTAKNPLVYGLSDTTCEAQRAAVEIADELRANLDTTTSTFHGPTVMALQAVGESTCTLGEIRDRADLVLLWGVNPLETDPRHYTRYSLMPTGRFVPRGRADRYCVVVDVRHTPTSDVADLALTIRPGSDFEALWALRALAAGQLLDAESVLAATGVELAAWEQLFERMRQARYGVILYGTGVTQTRGKHLNCEALLTLVMEMNRHTRFACKAMRGAGNVTGGDNVLTWRTGYPFGVNFARAFPRYNPGEYTAADLLSRREVDAALLVACDPSTTFGAAALDHLRSIPTVVIDARPTPFRQQAKVAFATAPYGLATGGTVYRMDEIPLTLRPAIPAARPSELEVLEGLISALRGRS